MASKPIVDVSPDSTFLDSKAQSIAMTEPIANGKSFFSLRSKVIGMIVMIFAVYLVIDFSVQRLLILPSFERLERSEAVEDFRRAVHALERELASINLLLGDWSAWDDSYQFVKSRSPEYLASNLNANVLDQVGLHFLYFYDEARRPIAGKSLNPVTGTAFGLETQTKLAALLDVESKGDVAPDASDTGIYMSPGGPLLVAARPVLNSEREGPARGMLVMGVLLDDELVQRIATQAHVDARITPISELTTNEIPSTDNRLTPDIAADDSNLVLSSTLRDLADKPAVELRVTVPRDIYNEGNNASQFAFLSLFVAGVIIMLVLVFVLNRTVLDPTIRLTAHAQAIGDANGNQEPLQWGRHDELGLLANEFDLMMERLAQARRQLTKQSHAAGVAEMASGVLHNIGNAITPLNLHLVDIDKTLKKLPINEISMTVEKLSSDGLNDEQRDLIKFLGLADEHAKKTLETLDESVTRATTHLGHVQQILASHTQFSRAENVRDTLDLKSLLEESISVIGHERRDILDIIYDPSVESFGKLTTTSIAVVQIFSNVVINASEAITRAGKTEGSLRIEASAEMRGGIKMAHIIFSDDGCGISEENLPRVFERGFSTKDPKPSGLGLHWCANILSGMRGVMYARSEGEGHGAQIHVLLPTVPVSKPTPS